MERVDQPRAFDLLGSLVPVFRLSIVDSLKLRTCRWHVDGLSGAGAS
jgi:hypothetical protein